MITKILSIAAGLSLSLAPVAFGADTMPTKFTVRIENITKPDAFTASNGVKWSLGFSPGVAIVYTDEAPIFSAGKKDRGKGLEAQSEDGDPSMLAKSLENGKEIKSVAVFSTPVGASGPGPITPGGAYEFTVSGAPGDRLSITTMMGQSNGWFYAPAESGIELFKNGKAINSDLTSQMILWDAGTEVNEAPGIGPNQGQTNADARRQLSYSLDPFEVSANSAGALRAPADSFQHPNTGQQAFPGYDKLAA